MAKTVYILRGLPGSGKSTWADKDSKATIVCSADDYFVNKSTRKYEFDPSKIEEAHKACLYGFINAVNVDVEEICVDNTNIHAWEISPYMAYAKLHDYKVIIINFPCDPMVAYKRNVHNVPLETIERMHNDLKTETLPPWWRVWTNRDERTSK